MPGEVIVNYTLLGPENRTLNEEVIQNADGGLDLILEGFDILSFSNETVYNLNFTQVNDMDMVEDYSITAEVSFKISLCCWLLLTVCVFCKLTFN